MIAYVFWHTRLASADAPDFEEGLRLFHAGLRAHRPAGFASSLSLRCERLPWMEDGTSYEDWYLVDDFTSLGELNDRAASGGHAEAHDRVASYSGHGTGGVYALEAGIPVIQPSFLYWTDRPVGSTTADFLGRVRSLVDEARGVLWRRQLSLGPAKEYCIHASDRLDLPFRATEVIPEYSVWPVAAR